MIIREQPDGGRLITDSADWGTYRLTLNGNATGHQGRLVGEDGLDYGTWTFHTSEPQPPMQQRQQPPPNRLARPGDWIKASIFVVTFGLLRPCSGCKGRIARLNEAGWRGLLPFARNPKRKGRK